MDEKIYTIDINNPQTGNVEKKDALNALETGKVLYFPSYFFTTTFQDMQELLSEEILDGKHKNVSFDYRNERVGGYNKQHRNTNLLPTLKAFMQGYAKFAKQIIDTHLPQYSDNLLWGRTSYRPAQIQGRSSSKRKDDTRLHVDSFAATPVNSFRILRVFCNINPNGEPRVWHLGEPFEQVFNRFLPTIPNYSAFWAKFLRTLKVTKTLRSAYDHYQLHLHDNMKLDDQYQQIANKSRIDFPAQSTWVVFTDHVSHAALSGQYLLEQTFYLPVSAMETPQLSPLCYWQREKAASFCTVTA